MKRTQSITLIAIMLITMISQTGCQPPIINPDNGPLIIIKALPEYEISGSALIGRINGVRPNQHRIVVYLKDAYGWRNCLSNDKPLISIDWYSGWSCPVGYLSHYNDYTIAIFLVPKDTQVPMYEKASTEQPNIPEALTSLIFQLDEFSIEGEGESEGEGEGAEGESEGEGEGAEGEGEGAEGEGEVEDGDPRINFSEVPEYETYDNLQGMVGGVNPVEHKIAFYRHSTKGWENEPSTSYPLTNIGSDGKWSCSVDTTTRDVIEYVGYLVRKDTIVPLCSPCADEPVIPEALARASAEIIQPTTIDPEGGPKIFIKEIPIYETSGNLKGTISGVDPYKHQILVFAFGTDGWENLPGSASPLTNINYKSEWTCQVGTIYSDVKSFIIYLVPIGTIVPICAPCNIEQTIPESLATLTVEMLPPPTIDSAGGPKVNIMNIPIYDWTGRIKGSISGVNPYEYAIAAYTKSVNGNWRKQPSTDNLLVKINYQSNWETGISYLYGDNSDLAAVYVVLVPINTVVPQCNPCTEQPSIPEAVAEVYIELPPPTIADPGSDPKISIIQVPEYGKWGNVIGKISGTDPYGVKIVAYANFYFSGWRNMPSTDKPYTDIDWGSNWEVGNSDGTDVDSDADCYLFYAVPNDTVVPICDFCDAEPVIPEAIAMIKVSRPNPAGNPDYTQQVVLTTNLTTYPLIAQFPRANKVQVDGVDVFLDDYGVLFQLVDLLPGLNSFVLYGINSAGEIVGEPSTFDITYDPNISTEGDELLYVQDEKNLSSTIVVNLTQEQVWGILTGVIVRAASHNGKFIIDDKGNVYQTSDHTVNGAPLSIPAWNNYPMFGLDDQYVYTGNTKWDFATRTIAASGLPINAVSYGTTITLDNIMITDNYANSQYVIDFFDLATETLVQQVVPQYTWIDRVDPTGKYGFYSTYSWASGELEVFDLEYLEPAGLFTGLDDYMGYIDFSPDGKIAYAGAGGNEYYGGGGVYLYSLDSNQIMGQYGQYGAYSIAVGTDGRVYARSAFEFFEGYEEGNRGHQGIEVLEYNETSNELEFVKTYFLGNRHWCTGYPILIKPGTN